MFGPEPSFIELTLAAALRDADAKRVSDRVNAMHALASATLRELDERGEQAWDAASRHPEGQRVVAALRSGLDDEDPQVAGLALLGLGRLGEPATIEIARERLDRAPTDDARRAPPEIFQRECALIALSHLGEAADGHEPDIHRRVLEQLRGRLQSELDDVRFQAGPAIARVGGHQEIAGLRTALRAERHPEVREHLVVALRMLDAEDPETCEAMRDQLHAYRGSHTPGAKGATAADPTGWPAAFEAARVLAGAGHGDGAPELARGLAMPELRDDALEALAVMPPGEVDGDVIDNVRRLVSGWFTPTFTRVRAAYVLTRHRPSEGEPWLARLEQHRRLAVREAVRDARAALARLEARSS